METYVFLNEFKLPVNAMIELKYPDKILPDYLPTNDNGEIEIKKNGGEPPEYIIAQPLDGHWCSIFYEVPKDFRFECRRLENDSVLDWWAELLGLRRAPVGDRKIKVGMVDVGFGGIPENTNVTLINIEGEKANRGTSNSYHGFQVSRIIDQEINRNESRDTIYLVDAEDDYQSGELDFRKICAAIVTLVDEYKVDLINISGGSYLDTDDEDQALAFQFLAEAVEYANDYGCVVIAAVGNDNSKPIAFPAAFESVIGVGAIGLSGLGPEGSLAHHLQQEASLISGCVGDIVGTGSFFHYTKTSYGDKLDVVAPGIGVFLRYLDGTIVECIGTSYAAPIVTAALAIALSTDDEYANCATEARVSYVRARLTSMCQDLGMQQDRQGWGVPIIA